MASLFLVLSFFLVQAPQIKSVGIATESVQFLLPPTFTPSSLGNPVILTNYKSESSGIMPPGGVRIEIAFWEKKGLMRDFFSKDFKGQAALQPNVSLNDRKGIGLTYTNEYAPEFREKTTAVYVEGKDAFYKIFLTYHADNPRAEAYEEFFKGLLLSLKFLK